MRTTVIEKLNCTRHVPYDPNNHAQLNRHGRIEHRVDIMEEGRLGIRIRFEYKLIEDLTDTEWGTITGEALTVIEDPTIKLDKDGESIHLENNIQLVLAGAINDDIMLPVSQLIHGMRLPSPMAMLPLSMPGENDEEE